MLTFILSRGVPTEKYSTNGVFEFDQADKGTQASHLILDVSNYINRHIDRKSVV